MQYEKSKVAFIGLGIMGSRMAMNLLKNDINLVVYNRSGAPGKLLKNAGATLAESAKDAVEGADLVFTMLSTPDVVRQVMLSKNGGLAHMKKGALWVDCSTVNPSFSLESKSIADQHDIKFLDAPVAGTKPHAENAQLTFFVGGPEALVNSVRPLMDFMGQKVLHIGPHGKGASFKMLVNAMLAQSMIIFSETILLGEKMGIDKDFLLNTIPNLIVSAPFTKFKAEMIRNENYDVQFPLEWMHKDLHLAALTAYENDQPLYLVNIAKELFADAKKSGMGRLDFAAIHDYLEKKK